MSSRENIIAIGRSRFLYNGINHLAKKGYTIKAIVSEEAYDEYDIKHGDFESLAAQLGAKFFMTKSLSLPELIEIVKENNIRAAISVNWKYTIPKSFLDLFECGILNFHLGNLPDYKGNATVNWSIINGEKEIFGNVHKMDPELDAGDIISRKSIPIGPDTYINEILKQAEIDVPILYEKALNKILKDAKAFVVKGTIKGVRCYPRLPEDSEIHWFENARAIYRLIRASAEPYNGAYSFINGNKIIIWRGKLHNHREKFLAIPGHVVGVDREKKTILVACGKGILEILEIEVEGKRMFPADYIKSIRVRFKQSYHA